MTFRTWAFSQKLIGPLLSTARIVAIHDRAQIFDDAIKVDEIIAGGMYQFLVNTHTLKGTVKNLVECLFGYIRNAGLDVAVVFMENSINLPEDHLILVFP